MSALFICDECGTTERADRNAMGDPIKPARWWSRTPIGEATIHACSRECMRAVDKRTGHDPMFPLTRKAVR